ncbi:MAG: hypothetical protein GY847_00730, partial [Proteobacteria bacterium]|nr:hypothetical protein [Pseudomonadota bacterium]
KPMGFFSYEWSGALLAVILGLAGIILILASQVFFTELPRLWSWVPRFLQDAGLAFLITGTASAFIEKLVKKRTEAEFREQMAKLLGTTADSLSTDILSYLQTHIRDIESRLELVRGAIRNSNIEMIFVKRQDGFAEMARAIREAKLSLFVMGVSLREFSKLDTPLCHALKELHLRASAERQEDSDTADGLDVKMLILNNQSTEALNRSSIEEKKQFSGPLDPEYKISNLFRDTRDTILDIQAACPEIQLRVYDNLSLFLLITERYVFMEPYHSGVKSLSPLKEPREGVFERVAELVPMIQFRKESQPGPYEQFHNHFAHVFEQAHPPTKENIDIGNFAPSAPPEVHGNAQQTATADAEAGAAEP